MPRTVHSNGVNSELKALAVIQLNKPVTPQEINDCVKTGDYAAKYVSMLKNTYGFKFDAKRVGRRIVSYTLISEPDNAAELRNQKPKVKVINVVAKVVSNDLSQRPSARVNPVERVRKTAAKIVVDRRPKVAVKKSDAVVREFGTTGSVGTIDADWDSIDGLDVKQLV